MSESGSAKLDVNDEFAADSLDMKDAGGITGQSSNEAPNPSGRRRRHRRKEGEETETKEDDIVEPVQEPATKKRRRRTPKQAEPQESKEDETKPEEKHISSSDSSSSSSSRSSSSNSDAESSKKEEPEPKPVEEEENNEKAPEQVVKSVEPEPEPPVDVTPQRHEEEEDNSELKMSDLSDGYGDTSDEVSAIDTGKTAGTGFVVKPTTDPFEQERVPSTRVFQWRSIAHSILRSINMFREAAKKDCLVEDWRLFRAAMNHSRKMGRGQVPFDTNDIEKHIVTYPFVYYFAAVSRLSSMNNAFTSVVNEWTTDSKTSKTILMDFNCAGVGVSVNQQDEVYFTLILALRTNIGFSFYTGTTLRSIILAEKCTKIVNRIRHDEFQLLPIIMDPELCSMAYRFAGMDPKALTRPYIQDKIGVVSLFDVGYGSVVDKKATPENIVENWMNQLGRTKTILGDFNRVGFGFVTKETGQLYSVGLYVRSLQAAVIDGTETVMDGTIIANQILDMMNEFREQHSLQALSYDTDLCLAAQDHTEYIANGKEGDNPLDGDFFVCDIEPKYVATDISHMCCNEMSRAPKVVMAKWRNNVDCISVLLNQIDDIGIGVCFDKQYVCHITIIIGSYGKQSEVTNIIYRL